MDAIDKLMQEMGNTIEPTEKKKKAEVSDGQMESLNTIVNLVKAHKRLYGNPSAIALVTGLNLALYAELQKEIENG